MNSKNGILDPSQICKFKTGCGELFGKIRLMARAFSFGIITFTNQVG
jgi:hypothetical protein